MAVKFSNSCATALTANIAAGVTALPITSNSLFPTLGSGSAAAAVGNTALGTELGSSRIALTTDGGTVSNATVQYDATWSSSHGAYAIQEAGIFNHASAGTMLARTVFAVINKGTDDTVTISWTITVS